MTENECIEILQYLLGYENAVDKGEIDTPNNINSQEKEALRMILEEVQAYRAIGTVERLLQLQHDYWYLNEMCKEYQAIGTVEELNFLVENIGSIKLLKEYSAIGTIEEFKALKEKSVAKKPIRDKEFSSLFECPTCGRRQKIMYELYHCKECGQKLDWQ